MPDKSSVSIMGNSENDVGDKDFIRLSSSLKCKSCGSEMEIQLLIWLRERMSVCKLGWPSSSRGGRRKRLLVRSSTERFFIDLPISVGRPVRLLCVSESVVRLHKLSTMSGRVTRLFLSSESFCRKEAVSLIKGGMSLRHKPKSPERSNSKSSFSWPVSSEDANGTSPKQFCVSPLDPIPNVKDDDEVDDEVDDEEEVCLGDDLGVPGVL